jgi:hypothetical protein
MNDTVENIREPVISLLTEKMRAMFHEDGITEQADGKSVYPILNSDGWHSLVTRISQNLVIKDVNFNWDMDCWYIKLCEEKNGYPRIKAYSVSIKKNRPSAISDKVTVKVCHVVWYLFADVTQRRSYRESRGARNMTISHLCQHYEPKEGTDEKPVEACCNPKHLRRESDRVNKDRIKCRYGSGSLCPHQPVCIFVSQSGSFDFEKNPNN